MSLYYDAASVLQTSTTDGSLKSRIYNSNSSARKSSPAQVYALISEASKWDTVLKEVIENAGILSLETKLTPLLALLLVHDHLLSKTGIAAATNHPLRLAIERHKSRLKAEFVKARLRRECSCLEELRTLINGPAKPLQYGDRALLPQTVQPRWIRINTLRTTVAHQLATTFSAYTKVSSRNEATQRNDAVYIDTNISCLLAMSANAKISTTPAYQNGEIILQDKASCFPACLLLGEEPWGSCDVIDACAAPGNKTTHLAALLSPQDGSKPDLNPRTPHVFACDASRARSKTLQRMVSLAGADDLVTVIPGQDFLALDLQDKRFRNVEALLLDPSCSGSGIVGRKDVPTLDLPVVFRKPSTGGREAKPLYECRGSKRKRKGPSSVPLTRPLESGEEAMQGPTAEATDDEALALRLEKLSSLQLKILEHAFSFPKAKRITYSTCSVHVQENEQVVARGLASWIAKERRWRVLKRDEQTRGLREWKYRGEGQEEGGDWELGKEELDACLRCWPGNEEGTSGFFVCGFVRDKRDQVENGKEGANRGIVLQPAGDEGVEMDEEEEEGKEEEEEEEWNGFSSG